MIDRDGVAAALPNYEIGEELGRGAWGVVLSGRHRELDRPVAIKVLPPGFGVDPEVRARFQAEARLLASLTHPHVVQVHDYSDRLGTCVVVMEYLDGGTLWRLFTTEGLTIEQSCAVAVATADALHHAHELGVLHRDVKPENIMFSADGTLKVTDFGIAKVLGGGTGVATSAGAVLGTPEYMSPEQAMGRKLTGATDAYSLGVVLYELLSTRLPFPESEDRMAALRARASLDPAPLGPVAPNVPRRLVDVVMQSLDTDPEVRFGSAMGFGVELARTGNFLWGTGWTARSGFRVMPSGPIATMLAEAPPPRSGPRTPTVRIQPPPGTSEHRSSEFVPAETRPDDLRPAPEVVAEQEGAGEPPRPSATGAGRRGRPPRGLLVGAAVLGVLLVVVGTVALLGGGGSDDEGGGGGGGGDATPDFVRVTDDGGTLAVEAPSDWDEVDGRPSDDGPSLTVAPDVDAFRDDARGDPGLTLLEAPEGVSVEQAIAVEGAARTGSDCRPGSPSPFERDDLTGSSLEFDCGGDVAVGITAVQPSGGGRVLVLAVETVDAQDAQALLRALDTFGPA